MNLHQNTGTVNPAVTIHYEDGERVYPCRCGETHRGPYAIYDYGHHNCFHDVPLISLGQEIPGYYMCPDCGKHFWLKDKMPPHPPDAEGRF